MLGLIFDLLTGDFWFLIPAARIYNPLHITSSSNTYFQRPQPPWPPTSVFSSIQLYIQPAMSNTLMTNKLSQTSSRNQVRVTIPFLLIISSPDVAISGFLISLQTLAADKTLSQPERLMASLITGREMKTKWRSKAYVPC